MYNQSLVNNIIGPLKGVYAVVTGAASGIGKEIATLLAEAKCKVIACDINEYGLNSLVEETKKNGLDIRPYQIDLTSIREIIKFCEKVDADQSAVHLLVNCAGLCTGSGIEEVEEDEWVRIFDINLKGLFFLSQKMIPILQKNTWGRIINISSLAGYVGGILASPAYSASKAGVTCLTKSFAKYLASSNINVNEISPGTADTEMTHKWLGEKMYEFIDKIPLGRLVKPSDIAFAVLFLASPLSEFITGQVIHVNGGIYMH